MLEHFGAPPFDLYTSLDRVIRTHRDFEFTWTRRPGRVRTTTLEDTLKVARFVLNDRDEDAFSRQPTEEEFQDYVRAMLWNDKGSAGGWENDDIICLVRRTEG
jgi:hypothetical protein